MVDRKAVSSADIASTVISTHCGKSAVYDIYKRGQGHYLKESLLQLDGEVKRLLHTSQNIADYEDNLLANNRHSMAEYDEDYKSGLHTKLSQRPGQHQKILQNDIFFSSKVVQIVNRMHSSFDLINHSVFGTKVNLLRRH